jgi:hypothetical protein
MISKDTLLKAFTSIGLKLEFSKTPIARTRDAEDVFGLDIRRKISGNARTEYFLMWLGHEDNKINVAATDAKLSQLVLSIKEPSRTFWSRYSDSEQKQIKKLGLKAWIAAAQKRTTRKFVMKDFGSDGFYEQMTTPANQRHYLMGRDERQLFMCQLPKAATSVKAAMESLKAPTVILAEGKQLGKTLRQGEWFLLNPTPEETEVLKKYLKSSLAVIHKKASVGQFAGRAAGKPHVAEELIAIPDAEAVLSHGFRVRPRSTVFIRGALRHSDHETLKLGDWRKVILNAEPQAAGGTVGFAGSTWID